MVSRACSQCGVDKELTIGFHANALCRGGYNPRCRTCVNANVRAQVDASPSRQSVKVRGTRASYDRNKERANARSRAWYAANRERSLAKMAEWVASHPAEFAAIQHNRRARERSAPGVVTAAEMRGLRASSLGLCAYCLRPAKLAVEHVTALAAGGEHSIDNLVMACASCNSRKGTRGVLSMLSRAA